MSLHSFHNSWLRGLPWVAAAAVCGLAWFAGSRVLDRSEKVAAENAWQLAVEGRESTIALAIAAETNARISFSQQEAESQDAEDRLEAAKRNLETFRDFVDHSKPIEPPPPAANTSSTETSETDQTASLGDRPNPRYETLKKELDSLKDRRDELLERYTAAHPQVRDMELRIGQVSADLETESPQLPLTESEKLALARPKVAAVLIQSPAAGAPTLIDPDSNAANPSLPASPSEFFKAAQRLKDLTVSVDEAERDLGAASAKQKKAGKDLEICTANRQQAERCPQPVWEAVTAASKIPSARFANVVLALLLGAATGWTLSPRRPQPFTSAAQLQRAIPFPLLGVIIVDASASSVSRAA